VPEIGPAQPLAPPPPPPFPCRIGNERTREMKHLTDSFAKVRNRAQDEQESITRGCRC